VIDKLSRPRNMPLPRPRSPLFSMALAAHPSRQSSIIARMNRILPVGIAVVMALWSFSRMADASDVVLLHGHIYTGNPRSPWVQALGVTGSKIDALGTDAAVVRHRVSGARVIDLAGRTVIPGIVDAHVHLLFGAMALNGFNLSTPTASVTPDKPDELIARIREYAARHPTDKILIGRGDFSSSPPYAPTRALLDRAVPDRPVIIHSTFEHSLWVNSKALTLAGITDEPVASAKDEQNIIRDASGHPSGILIESAMQLMERAVQAQSSAEDQLSMLRDAMKYLNSFGITSVINATGDLAEINLYGTLRDRGQMTVRTRNAFGAVAVAHQLTPQFLADLDEARARYHDEWVSADLVKFFADGSTGLIPPLVYEPANFKDLVKELDKRKFQIMTHAERSDSVHMVLDAYEGAARANGPRDRRFRIEHATVVDDADITRFDTLSVIVSMQPIFCCSETGTNYAPGAPPSDQWHTFAARGVTLAFGTDWPCASPPDPFVNIQEAVVREIWRSDDTVNVMNQPFDGAGQAGGRPTGRIYSESERITVQQAVDAYTRGAAYSGFMDTRVGTLEIGKEADLAVLSQDVFSVAPREISKTKTVMTMVGGKVVYEAER
jgi:predicted amidohydrolase YtcJ